MRNSIRVLLILLLILMATTMCLTGCSKKDITSNNETVNTSEMDIIETYIDDTLENKISFAMPKNVNGKYLTKTTSDFSKGYYAITIQIIDTDYDLFTIYCSKNDSYKKYEKNKNYEILKSYGGYTCIWYEHEFMEIGELKSPDVIQKIQDEYKSIKSSFNIGK